MADALLIEGNVASGKRVKAGGNIFYTDGGSRYVKLKNNSSFDNPAGVTDFGPPSRAGDPLLLFRYHPYFERLALRQRHGAGCRTYGDINFTGNYWSDPLFYDICPYTDNGVSYPTNLIYKRNHVIAGKEDVPRWLMEAAGVRKRPAAIPPERWVLPTLAGGESEF